MEIRFGIYSRPLNVDLTRLVRAKITMHTSYTSKQALTLLAEVKSMLNCL